MSFGLPESNIHFLNLPFYESGGVAKNPCTQVDIDIIKALLRQLRPDQVYLAVPLSPDEVIEKRHAIYRHLSQKDIVPFPGEDPREFWQRAEDRTQNTARQFDQLGMAEYQAMKAFVKYKI